MIPDPLERQVQIPIRFVAGTFESLYGGPLPDIKDTTIGTLTIPAFAFGKPEQLQAYIRELTCPILPAKSRLLVQVSGALTNATGLWTPSGERLPLDAPGPFVELVLEETLELTLRGSAN